MTRYLWAWLGCHCWLHLLARGALALLLGLGLFVLGIAAADVLGK